jgi:16S rRNA (uracil1498-N3)-methyltransferase
MQPRILFHPLRPGEIDLDAEASHHLAGVLRIKPGGAVILFDGQGQEAQASVSKIARDSVRVQVGDVVAVNRESPLDICVVQALCTGDKMDWVVQKSTELGATTIIPLAAARSVMKLDENRAEKRRQHWVAIAQSAAAQSGRTVVPSIAPVIRLPDLLQAWSSSKQDGSSSRTGLLLDPFASDRLATTPLENAVTCLIGPEAGWTDEEESLAKQAGFIGVACGPRILRTETAAAVVLTALAVRCGEF